MKILITLSIVLFPFTLLATPQPVPKDLSKAMRTQVEKSGYELLAVEECPFLLQIFDPKDVHVSQLGLCFFTEEKTVGIYKQVACVGALVEAVSGVKNPFYGNKGHWGMEKPCTKERLEAKLKEKKTDTTLNPITDLRMKIKEGRRIRLLRDDLGVWPTVKKELSQK